jgi:hypothetical protein
MASFFRFVPILAFLGAGLGCSVYESPARKYLESTGYATLLRVAAVNSDSSCSPISDEQIEGLKTMSPSWWAHNALKYDDQLHSYFICPAESPNESEPTTK